MDPLDLAVLALRLALLLLLYGLVLAVVRAANRLLDQGSVERSRRVAVARGHPTRPREVHVAPSREGSALELLVRVAGESGLEGQRLAVLDGAVLGRDPGSGVVLSDPTISAQHARVRRDGLGRWLVEDLGSTNGTFVNGAQVRDGRAIGPGDLLTLGALQLEVQARE